MSAEKDERVEATSMCALVIDARGVVVRVPIAHDWQITTTNDKGKQTTGGDTPPTDKKGTTEMENLKLTTVKTAGEFTSTSARADAEIHRGGTAITVPEGLTIKDAITALTQRMEDEERVITVIEEVDAIPPDGAVAFHKALARTYGWTRMVPTPGFFKDNPPKMISIQVGPFETIKVPWGRVTIPGIEGWLHTTTQNGNFAVHAEIRQKHQGEVTKLMNLTRQIAKEESIYKGRALRIDFDDDNQFDRMRFVDLSNVRPSELVLRDQTRDEVEACVFGPILDARACAESGVQAKRGVLLLGAYGCGKTMVGRVAAKHAQDVGRTFILLDNVEHIAEAIEMAVRYAPAVIFAEDLDRIVGRDRSVEVDAVLNTIDGIANKDAEIMVVLTTNNVAEINKAMLRPGRLDAVIEITAPDADAAARLFKLYGRGLVEATDQELKTVGEVMSGQIPAVLREVVERAKLFGIAGMRRAGVDTSSAQVTVTGEALMAAAVSVLRQVEMIAGETPEPLPVLDQVLADVVQTAIQAHEKNGSLLKAVDRKVTDLHNAM